VTSDLVFLLEGKYLQRKRVEIVGTLNYVNIKRKL
jgi:hypothetical protein